MAFILPKKNIDPNRPQTFLESTTADAYSASAQTAIMQSIPSSATLSGIVGYKELTGNSISYELAKATAEEQGVPIEDNLLKNTTDSALEARMMLKKREMKRQDILANTRQTTALSAGLFATNLGITFLDPAMLMIPGAGYVKFAQGVRAGKGLVAAAQTARAYEAAKLAQMGWGATLAAGAKEGLIAGAITEAAIYPAQQYIGADYTATDSMFNIAMGAPFGAVFYGAGKGWRDLHRSRAERQLSDYNKFTDKQEQERLANALQDTADIAPRPADGAEIVGSGLTDDLSDLFDAETLAAAGEYVPPPQPVQVAKALEAAKPTAPKEEKGSSFTLMAETVKKEYAKIQKNKAVSQKRAESKAQTELVSSARAKSAPDFRPRPIKKFIEENGYIKKGSDAHKQLIDARLGEGYIKSVVKPNGKIAGLDNIPANKLNERLSEYDYAATVGDDGYVSMEWLKEEMLRDETNPLMTAAQKQKQAAKEEMGDIINQLDHEYGIDIANASQAEIADALERIATQYDLPDGVDSKPISDILDANADLAQKIQDAPFELRHAASQIATEQMLDGRVANVDDLFNGATPMEKIAEFGQEFYDDAQLRDYEAWQERDLSEQEQKMLAKEAEDRAANDIPLYSRGNGKGGSRADELVNDVRAAFGKHTMKLLDAGKINVVQKVADLPDGFRYPDDVSGVKYPDGRVYLIADNVSPEIAKGVVLHEVGVHVGMRGMLGDARFQQLLDDVMASDSYAVREAKKRVPEDTPPEQIAEEVLAYLVQDAPELGGFGARVIAAVRAWLYKVFGNARMLDEASVRQLAIGALRRVSRLGDEVSADVYFSKQTVDDLEVVRFENDAVAKLWGDQKIDTDSFVINRKGVDEFNRMLVSINGRVDGDVYRIGEIINLKDQPLTTREWIFVRNEIKKQIPSTVIRIEGERLSGARKSLPIGAKEKFVSVAFDKTPLGDQLVIEGAEKISDKQLAERKMEGALKAKKPQKEMDIGMFGDDAKQTSLFFSRKAKETIPQPTRQQLTLALQDELHVFNKALKQAGDYLPTMQRALDLVGNEPALRDRLESEGVNASLIQSVIDAMGDAHRKTGNALRQEIRKLKSNEIADATQLTLEEMKAIVAHRQLMEKILLAKRHAAINFKTRQDWLADARSYGIDFLAEGLLARMTGSAMVRKGSRSNAANEIKSFERYWGNVLDVSLRKEGLNTIFYKGSLDKQVFQVLEKMEHEKPDLKGFNDDAIKIAKIVASINKDMLITQNRHGANIVSRKNYATQQSYDSIKVSNTKFDDFYKDAEASWDLYMMTGGNIAKAPAMVTKIYNDIITGLHETDLPAGMVDHDFHFGQNIAKKVSASRSIVFKEGAWYDFNVKYGTGSFNSSFVKSIQHAARATGVMKTLGINPQHNLDSVYKQLLQELEASVHPKAAIALKNNKKKIDFNLAQVMGETEIAVNINTAKIWANIRLWQMMSKLGRTITSAMIDVPNYARNAVYEGRSGLLGGMGEAVSGLFSDYKSGVRNDVLEMMQVTLDHLMADTIHAFRQGNTFSHNMSAAANQYTRLNFQRWWTTNLQKSQMVGFAHHMGKNADKDFDELTDEVKRLFTIHDISREKWDVLRKGAKEFEDGRVYLVTDALADVSDAEIAKYVASKGVTINDVSIAKARDEIAASYRSMLIDRIDSAVLTGDTRAQANLIRGTQRGEALGEFVRTAGQFKSYPLTYYERVIKREFQGQGYDTFGEYLREGKGDMLHFASFFAAQLTVAYMALSVEDLLQGKKPRPLSDPMTWVEMTKKSGAASLYGDFLLNEYGRNTGANFAEAMLGPTVGAASDIADISWAALSGDKFATSLIRTTLANTPGGNLIWIRPALDQLIMYELYETANPGFLRRMERRVEDRGQEWLLRPTDR